MVQWVYHVQRGHVVHDHFLGSCKASPLNACDDYKLAMSCFFTKTTDIVAGKLSSNTKQDMLAFVSYLKGQAKTPHSWPLHSWDPVEQQSRPTTRSCLPRCTMNQNEGFDQCEDALNS